MKTISVWATKGGVGKTTLTLNLAAGLAEKGAKVLVCDCDLQRSASSFARFSEQKGVKLPFAVIEDLPVPGFDGVDYMIVDHAPSDVTPHGGLVVMAYCPGPLDFWAVKGQRQALEGYDVIEVLNRVNRGREIDKAMLKKMDTGKSVVVTERNAFRRVLARGTTIYDATIIDRLYGAREAKKDITNLVEKVLDKLSLDK